MATLALAVVGAAVGGTLMPAGISVLGMTLTGAALGSQVGAFAGSYIDNALFGSSGQRRTVEGPRLTDLHITSSTEGAPIPRLYGRARLGGQLIWADRIRERITTTRSGGGSGKGGGSRGPTVETTEYSYFASFAVALAEGPVSGIGRVWADGRELDLSQVKHRLHKGTETQSPDSVIVARVGAASAPAYRGVAYIVFEDMALADFGNRIPQLSFEVHRAVEPFGNEIKGIVLIPGSGEFVYATTPVSKAMGRGWTESENVHTRQGGTDWAVAIDQLEATLPNAKSLSLVVSWFGTDLRAEHCQLRPGVEVAAKTTSPMTWSVAGLAREDAHLVSLKDGRPAYGGTPSDAAVIEAIGDLKERGFDVVLTPFILMDVPAGNTRPDPYSAATSQPVYPWRGRITCDPAPGEPGTPDKTATAASQVAAFVGTAAVSDFAIVNGTVTYDGPDEWSYRRMVLHNAYLAKAAGGVDAFVIGTEMRGLTQVRSGAATYPFVAALQALAADVKTVLPGAKVTYAADWSEYFGHQPTDGTGDVYFHLDPLWASSNIDAIGIDCYWPLSDWRDGTNHIDYLAGVRAIYDEAYLRSNVQGGEGYDWYYASAADREAQIRSPISDGHGSPWIFRYKDIRSWWLAQHVNRPGGTPSGTPTAWVPQSKPFWLMEIGCPAIDKGANQPNVFVDPKSSESAVPYFSRGGRDDLIQRRYLKALIDTFDPASEGYVSGTNPVSSVYGGRMVDLARIHVYCWDARPYPAFPYNLEVWGDGDNWHVGHWLNGRFAVGSLSEVVDALLADYGFADHDASRLAGVVPGYVIDRVMSPRDALQPLELAYFFDSFESEGRILFRHRGTEPPVLTLTEDDMVEERADEPLLTLTRAQETDLPVSAKLSHIAAAGDYRQAVAEARRLTGSSERVARAELPIVLGHESASQIADAWLFEVWAARERAHFRLPPSTLAVEPGDILSVEKDDTSLLVRVTEIGERGLREIEGRSIDPEVYGGAVPRAREVEADGPIFDGVPHLEFLDLPLLRGDEPPEAGYVAAFQLPWPGSVAVYGSPEDAGYVLRARATAPAVIGETLDPLPPGPIAVIDRASRVRVAVTSGELASITRLQLLAGGNAAAVRNEAGAWEVLQFETAALVGEGTYELRNLLRGQAGTELEMQVPLPAGASFVLLGSEVARVALAPGEVGLPLFWRYGPASRDIADRSYGAATHAFAGRGLRPLSPAHVRAERDTEGDITLTWKRRTRAGGDSWDAAEVPLAEDVERYEVDILDGDDVVRTIASTTPECAYTAAEQTDDFGSPQSALSVAVYQMSAAYGRGTPKFAVV